MKYEIYDFLRILFGRPLFRLLRLRLYDKREVNTCINNYKNSYETLKSLIDIRTLKPATGKLRKIQLNNLEFAKEIIYELKKEGINLFLFAGSLLGAERHGGFIPWDDDIDFACLRQDYNKLLQLAQTKYKIFYEDINRYVSEQVSIDSKNKILNNNPNEIIIIRHPFIKFIKGTSLEDCLQFDVFPLDYYSDDYSYNDHINYCKKIVKKFWEINNIEKETEFINTEIKNNPNIVEKSNTISYGLDNPGSYIPSQRTDWWTHDDFFPLKKFKFEDTEFYAPNNHIKILDYWCKNWREFPNNLTPPHAAERKA